MEAAIRAERAIIFKGKSVEGATYNWVFPGDVKRRGKRVKFTFPKPGTYPVTLNVKKGKRTGTITKKITVGKPGDPVIRSIKISKEEITEDNPLVIVDARATTNDPDVEVKQYRFYVIENGKVILSQVVDKDQVKKGGMARAVFDLWQFPGKHNYYIKVEAIDEYGKKTSKISDDSIFVRSTANNRKPTGSIMGNTMGTTTDIIFFHANFRDVNGDALNYRWLVDNDEPIGTNSSTVSHQFKSPGKHIIKVQVEDGISARFVDNTPVEAIRQINITGGIYQDAGILVENRPPEVLIRGVLPGTSGDTDTQFAFYAEGTDPDGDLLTYAWDFGDGSRASIQNVAYKYIAPGEYPVKVQVSDGQLMVERTVLIQVVGAGEPIPPNHPENDVDRLVEELEEDTGGEGFHSSSELNDDQVVIFPEDETSAIESLEKIIADQEATLEGIEDEEERKRIQQKILELQAEKKRIEEMKIKEETLCKKPFFLNPYFLRSHLEELKRSKINQIEKESDVEKKKLLNEELSFIDQHIEQSLYDRHLINQEELQAQLEEIKAGKNPGSEEVIRIQTQIDVFIECLEIRTQNVDIIGTPHTNFFFYAKLLAETIDRAILFEWDFGDGRKKMGQNARIRYPEPGIYEVVLRISNGLTEATDSVIIKIIGN